MCVIVVVHYIVKINSDEIVNIRALAITIHCINALFSKQVPINK